VARILIVGCGCRGTALARSLLDSGHQVRGTTRRPERLAAIESAGAEAALGDPDRLGTLMPALEGVSACCWLLASASGPPEATAALHGPRLQSMVEAVVDTPVRGLVYEGAGTVAADLLEQGSAIARAAARTYRMPVHVVEEPPSDLAAWESAMHSALEAVLAA